MKLCLLFRPEARLELLDAQEWYEGNVPGLGKDFAHIVDTALSAIEDAPRAFPVVYGDIRQAVLRRFPLCPDTCNLCTQVVPTAPPIKPMKLAARVP